MKIVIFGLTITSSWGNGHATLWRGLCKALARQRHQIVFFERDVSYYAGARDFYEFPGIQVVLYPDWDAAYALTMKSALAHADLIGLMGRNCKGRGLRRLDALMGRADDARAGRRSPGAR